MRSVEEIEEESAELKRQIAELESTLIDKKTRALVVNTELVTHIDRRFQAVRSYEDSGFVIQETLGMDRATRVSVKMMRRMAVVFIRTKIDGRATDREVREAREIAECIVEALRERAFGLEEEPCDS